MLEVLDILFHILHLLIISINLFGWVSRHLLYFTIFIQGLTILSWVGLGVYYGFGYCFLTDWHWQVKYRLLQENIPHSYTKLLADYILNRDLSAHIIDYWTFGLFILACFCSSIRLMKIQKGK